MAKYEVISSDLEKCKRWCLFNQQIIGGSEICDAEYFRTSRSGPCRELLL